jgi:hypothetical protein
MQEILKIAFVLVTAPIWLPFLKAMRRELNDLFEEDGGLFGDDPGPVGREAIRARRARRPSVLVHEWLAHVRSGSGRAVGGAPRAAQSLPARRVDAAPRPRTGNLGGQRSGPNAAPGSSRRGFRS